MSHQPRNSLTPKLAVTLAFAALFACSASKPGEQWARATRSDLIQEVEVQGEMRASDSISVGPPAIPSLWEFKLVYVIEEGEAVEPGTRLLAFDTEPLEQLLEVALTDANRAAEEQKRRFAEVQLSAADDRMALAEAEANAQKNRLKTEQPAELSSGLALKQAALDRELSDQELLFRQTRARTKESRDQADLTILANKQERANAAVQTLKNSIEQMTVRSPRQGIVIRRAGRDGEKKKPGDSSWRSEAILDVVTLSNLFATGSVDEVYSSQLATGQPLTLRMDAYPDKSYEGRLKKLHQAIRREGESTVIDVDIELTTQIPLNVRPGMRFRGKIETSRLKNVLNVPIETVFVEPRGPVLYVKTGQRVEPRLVKLGKRTDRAVEILSGLAAGDQVLKNQSENPPSASD